MLMEIYDRMDGFEHLEILDGIVNHIEVDGICKIILGFEDIMEKVSGCEVDSLVVMVVLPSDMVEFEVQVEEL